MVRVLYKNTMGSLVCCDANAAVVVEVAPKQAYVMFCITDAEKHLASLGTGRMTTDEANSVVERFFQCASGGSIDLTK